jgi:uncharacterized phosphatase
MLKSDLVNQSSDLKSGPEMDDLQHSTAASPSTSGVSSSVNNSVVCVRHGETVWKCEGRTQGQLDSPLTGRGISQVHELAEKLDAERFDLVLCSPLGRAVQTAEILCHRWRMLHWRQSDYWQERYEGAFEGLTRQEQIERFPECFDRVSGCLDPELIPDTEPAADFLARVRTGLQEIGACGANKKILIVTHTGVLQALTSLVFGEDFGACAQRRFGFCEELRFDWSKPVD